jgi:[citrate (pro-3S)-lyase] ligase
MLAEGMEQYKDYHIAEMPLGTPFFRAQVERFLGDNALAFEEVDSYFVVTDGEGAILSGAGIKGDVIKCVAVAEEHRSEGLMAPLISHIIGLQGGRNLKVFTKPEYRTVFESLGFHLLAEAPKAILLENGGGLEAYVRYLAALPRKGVCGVVVMNANPFTLGHRHLLEVALKQVDTLFVLPVKEDVSFFPYAERRSMLEAVPGVVLAEGSAYQISAATFPTYFLKDLSEASETQMQLDIDLFARQIAPALGVSVRFVGEEPEDALTSRYNSLMAQMLPSFGISTVVVPRLRLDGVVVSASRVRRALLEGHFADAARLTPGSVHPYLLSALAVRALRMELDTPLKPGLVGPDSSGAHHDMDYGLMQRGIAAIRPYLSRMACAETAEQLVDLGLAAEKEMLSATLGVNTHRGAIFCLGIALAAAGGREMETLHSEDVMQNNVRQIAEVVLRKQFSDSELHFTLENLHGARALAAEAYAPLFRDWLPLYRQTRSPQRTLLRIMSTLEDTCVLHRVGAVRAQRVREEAAALLDNYSEEGLKQLCIRYAREGISPGGAADMLALTIFIDSIL